MHRPYRTAVRSLLKMLGTVALGIALATPTVHAAERKKSPAKKTAGQCSQRQTLNSQSGTEAAGGCLPHQGFTGG